MWLSQKKRNARHFHMSRFCYQKWKWIRASGWCNNILRFEFVFRVMESV